MKNKAIFSLLTSLTILCFFQACDKISNDVVIGSFEPENNRNIIFHCNNVGTAFEYTQLYREGTDVTITIVSQPKLGKIEPIGDKIIRYLPDTTIFRALDSFVIAIKKNGKTLKKTIFMNITDDIPCSEQAVSDLFVLFRSQFTGSSSNLDLLSNDKPCVGTINPSTKVIESVPSRGSVNLVLQNQFSGVSEINNNFVSYFPTVGFVGTSFFTYKVKNTINDLHFYYANVKVNTISSIDCDVRAVDDKVFWQRKTDIDDNLVIDVTKNDFGCSFKGVTTQGTNANLGVEITKKPLYGSVKDVKINNLLGIIEINYSLNDKNATSDQFEYKFSDKNSGTSNIAKVNITIAKPDACKTILSQDYLMFSGSTRAEISYPVLKNDLLCSDFKNIKIVSLPNTGTAEIRNYEIYYKPVTGFQGKVRIIYEVETEKGERLQSDLILDVSK